MARVALLVTVLAAVAYISQAIPVPENVEDEQLKSKEIFDQIQPESKEILDQVQPESKEILDQVQPESKEILDQNQPKSEEIQPKSEENLDQPDDTSKDELEDPKNKDWHDHKENILKQKLERLKKILEGQNNQWKIKGMERQIEKIQQRIRRNSAMYIANVNDIREIFTDQLLPIVKNASSQFKSFVQNELKEIPKVFLPLMENMITQLENKNGINYEKFAENLKKVFEKFEVFKKNISSFINDNAKDFMDDVVKKVENGAKKIIENLKEPNQEKIEDIFNELKKEGYFFKSIATNILKNGLNAYTKVFYNVFDNFKNAIKTYLSIPLNIIKLKINNFEEAKEIITDLMTIFVKQAEGIMEEGFKKIENENGIINNILNNIANKANESKDKIGELFGNISKTFEDPFNRFKDTGILSKIKRD